MALKEIIERAGRERRQFDHIAWRGICTKCGLHCNIFAEKCKRLYGDERVDARKKEFTCENQRCNGRIKVLGRMDEERAIRLHDIMRRK